MLIRFWGTRGSIPAPGPNTVRYGGNTSCVEISNDSGGLIVVDAGTGARGLGSELMSRDGPPSNLHLLLTHCHWDHVQGIPFFEPLRSSDMQVHVRIPEHLASEAARILETQFDPIFFPVAAAQLRATISFAAAEAEEQMQGFTVASAPVLHPGGALAYRVAPEGDHTNAVVFALDSELDGVADSDAPLAQLVTGARVLVHDAMYTVEEYADRRGWGHSSINASVELAMRLGVEMLVLHHHHPDRSDDDIDAMVLRCRQLVATRSSRLKVIAACDGMELEL